MGEPTSGNALDAPLLATEAGSDAEGSQACFGGLSLSVLLRQLQLLVVDIVGFAIFVYVFPRWLDLDDTPFYLSLVGLLVLMILWRLFRRWYAARKAAAAADLLPIAGPEEGIAADMPELQVPYTCGFVEIGGRQLYLLATVHISPLSARHAKEIVDLVKPNIVMIELDEERLDSMRDRPEQEPKPQDLQPITFTHCGDVKENESEQSFKVLAQRALWNAEWCGKTASGEVVYDSENQYGLERPAAHASDSVYLVCRGPLGKPGGQASFVNKAHIAASGGAVALLVMNGKDDIFPQHRIGGGTIQGELQAARYTRSLSYPPIPVLLLRHQDGERLRGLIERDAESSSAGSRIRAEFKIMDDHYPRKTLRRALCQSCAMAFSGIGILYGIIRCFKVEVGGEFTEAEQGAQRLGVPCACIDVNTQQLCGTIGWALLPTPCNILRAVWAWLALPRCLVQMLFPPLGNIDHCGSMVLHAKSFSCRTWCAFFIAGWAASQVTSHILKWGTYEVADVAEKVDPKDVTVSTTDLQLYLMDAIMMYLLPCVYDGILASRDEAMYRSIVANANKLDARRMVAVAGAAHTNGILKRCRERGLGKT